MSQEPSQPQVRASFMAGRPTAARPAEPVVGPWKFRGLQALNADYAREPDQAAACQ